MVIKNLKNIYLPISLLSSKIHNHSRTCINVSKPCSCMVHHMVWAWAWAAEEERRELWRWCGPRFSPGLPFLGQGSTCCPSLGNHLCQGLPLLGQPPIARQALARATIASCGGSVRTIQLIFTFLSVFHHSSNGEIQNLYYRFQLAKSISRDLCRY